MFRSSKMSKQLDPSAVFFVSVSSGYASKQWIVERERCGRDVSARNMRTNRQFFGRAGSAVFGLFASSCLSAPDKKDHGEFLFLECRGFDD